MDWDEKYEGRVFSGGNNSAILSAISQNLTAANYVRDAVTLLSSLDDVVMRRRRDEHSEACNIIYTSQWTKQFRKMTPIFQIGSVTDSCNSRVDAGVAVKEDGLSKLLVRNARTIIVRARKVLFEATIRAIKAKALQFPKDGNWTSKPFELISSVHVQGGQSCRADSTTAYFRDGVWYLRAAVTNHPLEKSVADYRRQMFIEYVPVPQIGHSDTGAVPIKIAKTSMKMIHLRRSDGRLELATALYLLWHGRGFTGTMPNDDDLSDPIAPITQAFRENLVRIDQAVDSVTLSNIAILSLPLIMTLVPVAFIADVSNMGMLMYVLITDVFSTIPSLVKGIELIRWSTPSNEIVISFHAGDDNLRLVEVWAVQCKGLQAVHNIGVAMVVISVGALLLGLGLEIWAPVIRAHYLKSKQRKDSR